MRKLPLISILIVTYNSSEYIEDCLQALARTTYKTIEILVVDNASTDNTVELLKKQQKKITLPMELFTERENLGYAAGNNLAADHANGKYLFIINPDTTVTPNFLEPLIDKAEADSTISVCQPMVYLTKQPDIINLSGKITHFLGFDWIRDFEKKKVRKSGNIASFSGSGVLIKKDVFQQLGGFDPHYFMYYEDTDLSWRMRLMGYKLWYEPNSILYHDYKYTPVETYQTLHQKLFFAERNRLITLLKNYSLKSWLLLFPMVIVVEIAMICYAFAKGWGSQKLKAYTSIWQHRSTIIKQRKKTQALRVLSDRKLATAFVAKLTFKEYLHPVVKYGLNPLMGIYWRIVWPLL